MSTPLSAPLLLAIQEQRIPPVLLFVGACVIVAAAVAAVLAVKHLRRR
jgi:hypothetical protein